MNLVKVIKFACALYKMFKFLSKSRLKPFYIKHILSLNILTIGLNTRYINLQRYSPQALRPFILIKNLQGSTSAKAQLNIRDTDNTE